MIMQISLGHSLTYRQSALLKSEGRRRGGETHWAHSSAAEQCSRMGQLGVASSRKPACGTAKSSLLPNYCRTTQCRQFTLEATCSGHPDELYQ